MLIKKYELMTKGFQVNVAGQG